MTVGDIAVADDEGFISIVDRKKDMIIAGGVNIYPREVEEVLARHPQVDDVAVVGLPDDVYGERVTAFVVARRDQIVDPASLEAHVSAAVAPLQGAAGVARGLRAAAQPERQGAQAGLA